MAEISSINNANVATTTTTTKTSNISDDTKKKLETLGIAVTDDMTEAEAIQLIQQAQKEDAPAQENNSSTSEEVLSDIKTLATSIGVNYSDSEDGDSILEKICEKIDKALDSARPDQIEVLKGYFEELVSLDSEFSAISETQNNIYQAMEQAAMNNKYALGLK